MAKSNRGPVRVALIGAGGITGEHIKGFLAHSDKIRCVAMADVSEANLKRRTEQLGQPVRTYSDWKTMLREANADIDAVDICLPHHLHAAAILDACAARKHILCEKPMCMTLAEADRIGEAVRMSKVIYMSAHNQLFMPAVQQARKLIDSGALGRIYLVRSQDCFWANWGEDGNPFKGSWRANLKTQGGGVLIDTGYHPTYRLLYLAGAKPAAVRGTFGRYYQKIDGEDSASVQVRFDNGAIGEILTSWAFDNPHGSHQIHVIGDKGQVFGSGNELHFLPQGWTTPARQTFAEVNTFSEQIGHFADCVLQRRRPLHGYEEGRQVLEIITAATESAKGWEAMKPSRKPH